jgi:hypothetical protein
LTPVVPKPARRKKLDEMMNQPKNTVQQNPLWKSDISSAAHKFFLLSLKLYIHYCFYKSTPIDQILIQLNPVHSLTLYL